jgi:NADPH2:quinone reductase
MRAIRQHRFGGPEVLRLEELPDLSPGTGQVRVAVAAAGVHLLDTTIRAGTAGGPFPLPDLPMTPGREVAGVVDDVGAGVDHTWLGRPVTAHLGAASGGYATQTLVAVEALIPLAEGTDPAAAVAMVGTGRTALGILDEARLGASDLVVVTAAAGGLGTLLVQAAADAGATVVGTAGGPDKVALVESLGADVAVDHRQPAWSDEVRARLDGSAATVALDGVGGAVGRAAFELIAPGGRLVMFGYSAGHPTALTAEDLFTRGVAVTAAVGPRMLARPGGIKGLAQEAVARLAAGAWRPIVQRFPLADAAAAHRALTGRTTTGKVVLEA